MPNSVVFWLNTSKLWPISMVASRPKMEKTSAKSYSTKF